jgi:hypothetical protein
VLLFNNSKKQSNETNYQLSLAAFILNKSNKLFREGINKNLIAKSLKCPRSVIYRALQVNLINLVRYYFYFVINYKFLIVR